MQGPRPLADEMRRRIEARAPLHAATRQQRDSLVADEPRHPLGEVPCVGVLRHEDDELPVELLVQCREQQRQRRLRHARSGGERLGVGAQTIALAKLVDKGMKNRQVHDERPNRRVRFFDRSAV